MACRLYGYYGEASGHDPRVAWPTPEELQEEIEFEREFEPTLPQRWATLKEQKEAELAKRRATLVLTCFIGFLMSDVNEIFFTNILSL